MPFRISGCARSGADDSKFHSPNSLEVTMTYRVFSRAVANIAAIATFAFGALAPANAETSTPSSPGYGPMGNCPMASGGMMGPGMMGGGMMGMMGGGMGMGPGMMGGGMMGLGPLYMLNLTDEQRSKITKIGDEERQKHWATMGKMLEEQNKLRDLLQVDTPDAKKVGAAYGAIAQLQRQMIETHVQAHNQAEQLLNKEQREQLKNWRRGMGGRGWGMGPGMMGPGYGPGGMGPGMMNQ